MARNPNKQRRLGRFPQRKVEQRNQRPRFLIVCEGSETEPLYFLRFPVSKELVNLEVIGFAQDPLNIVNHAATLAAEAERAKDPYDQVWGVFDRDDVTIQRFNQALDLAKRTNISIAYSVEAFELWYLLHFDYLDTGVSRTQYKELLSTKLRREDSECYGYKKNDPATYDRLLHHQAKAIQNATQLLTQYDDLLRPYDNNPSTTVHLLVQELNKYARR